MAVALATSADYLQRTTELLSPASDSTVMFWAKLNPVPANSTNYILMDAPGTYTDYMAVYAGTTNIDFEGGPHDVTTTAPTADVWYHIAWVQSGTTQTCYVNGVSVGSFTYDRSAFTVGDEYLGSDTFDVSGGKAFAYFRSWQGALTQPQISAEMGASSAVLATNLWMDTPLTSDLNDISGNGRNWTQVGAATFVVGPGPSNATPGTATLITSLPYSTTQTMPVPFTAWYRYTAPTTDTTRYDELNILGFGDLTNYQPFVQVFSPDASTDFLSYNSATPQNVALQVPVVSATTYYFQYTPNTDAFGPVTLTVTAHLFGGNTSAPAGSILVNDDASGYPGVVVSATADQVLQFLPVIAAGEGGDVLATSHQVLLSRISDDKLVRYAAQLQTINGTTAFSAGTGGQKVLIRANQTSQTWYAGQRNFSNNPEFVAITSAGVQTTLATLSAHGVTAFAVNDDASLIYLAGSPTNTSSNVRVWNVAGVAFDADLVAAVANYVVTDMLFLEDQTLLVMYRKSFSPGDIRVVRYDISGTTLNTYTLASGVTIPTDQFGYRLAFAVDSPTSFWTWFHQSDGGSSHAGLSKIQNIEVATGTVLASRTYQEYELGVYVASPTATPTSNYGISQSCPFLLLREGLPPSEGLPPNGGGSDVGTPVTYPIRWLRRLPHLSVSQVRQFFTMAQLDAEVGVGLLNEPEPIVFLRWSDDGGHSWSSPEPLSMGPLGEYKRRVIWWQLGEARDRVFEISGSDPTVVALINLYLDAKPGVH